MHVTMSSSIVFLSPVAELAPLGQASLEVAVCEEVEAREEPGLGLVYDTVLSRVFVVVQPHFQDHLMAVTRYTSLTNVNDVSLDVVSSPSDAPPESVIMIRRLRRQSSESSLIKNFWAFLCFLFCVSFCISATHLIFAQL